MTDYHYTAVALLCLTSLSLAAAFYYAIAAYRLRDASAREGERQADHYKKQSESLLTALRASFNDAAEMDAIMARFRAMAAPPEPTVPGDTLTGMATRHRATTVKIEGTGISAAMERAKRRNLR